jgi:hypothetical protein
VVQSGLVVRQLCAGQRPAVDVYTIAVLEPDLALIAAVNDALPKPEHACARAHGAHCVTGGTHVAHGAQRREGVALEEAREELEQREAVGIVAQPRIDVADSDQPHIRVRGEEGVRRNPVGVVPVPLCVGGADELVQVRAPHCERDRHADLRAVWQGEVVLLDERGRVSEFELGELGAMHFEEGCKAWADIAKVERQNGEVGELRHVPAGEDGERNVVEGDLEGSKRWRADIHARLAQVGGLRENRPEVETVGGELKVLEPHGQVGEQRSHVLPERYAAIAGLAQLTDLGFATSLRIASGLHRGSGPSS